MSNLPARHIVWTVEWILEDTNRILTQSSSACTILQSQPFKRESKKRKRGAEQSTPITEPITEHVPSPVEGDEGPSPIRTEHAQSEPPPVGRPEPERHDPSATTGIGIARDTTTAKEDEVKTTRNDHQSIRVHSPEPESVPPKYAFYLLRPRTSSNRLVLVRLEPTATLGECLRGRAVLEYPTIYVFPEHTAPPSHRFMHEADYLQQEGEEQKELQDLLKHVSPGTLRALRQEQGDDVNAGEQIDSDAILNVLKQDIGAGV